MSALPKERILAGTRNFYALIIVDANKGQLLKSITNPSGSSGFNLIQVMTADSNYRIFKDKYTINVFDIRSCTITKLADSKYDLLSLKNSSF